MNGAKLAAFRGRVQASMESLFPATIKIGADTTEYAAATTGLKRTQDSNTVGTFNLDDDDISFRLRKEIYPTIPEVGSRLIWVDRSLVFRIVRAKDTEATDPAWYIGCEAIVK